MGFPPGGGKLPAQAIGQRQVGPEAPAVLAIHAEIPPASVHGDLGPLLVVGRSPDQEVGKVDPGFSTIKAEGPVLGAELIVRDLVIMIIGAEFQSVRPNHFREIVKDLIGVVDVMRVVGIDSDAE